MAFLHYGPHVAVEIDDRAKKRLMETIGAHATRGGWITVVDVAGHEWAVLITAGIPIWIAESD